MRLLILLFCLTINSLIAQIQQGGIPKYINNRDVNVIQPNTDFEVDRGFNPMVFQFGTEYQIDIDVLESSNVTVENGIYTYTLGIESPGAYGIGLIFDDFQLTENSELYFYDREQTMYLGAFNSNNNKPSNIFPTSIIKSESIIIELTVPKNELLDLRLNLGSIIPMVCP